MQVIEKLSRAQIEELHSLYQNEWWTKGRTLTETESCVNGSQLCFGLVDDGGILQGFARVLTDYTFKVLIFDLIVSNEHRNKGLANNLLESIKNHPKLKNVKHFELYCLPELFSFYEKHGFSSNLDDIKLMRFINS